MCLSGCDAPTSPQAGSGDSPAAPTTVPCPHCNCCCCVTSAAIQNARSGGVRPGNLGHSFDFVIGMDFAAGSAGRSDCALEWWERTNVPYTTGMAANTWTNMFALVPTSPTFGPWNNRVVPCPAGGSLSVTIVDIPSLASRPGRNVTRTLEFRLTVTSGGGCSCSYTSATARATQVLQMVNGALVADGSSFTIGESSTTP